VDRSKIKLEIQRLSIELSEQLIDIRHHLHQHPELSFHEEKTSAYIKAWLEQWQISYIDNVAGYGIVATIDAGKDTTIALRADMDALPIQETNVVTYKSKVDGCMHACGHDVHMTCGLGALYILKQLKDQLPVNVKMLFQPGEEKLPGGASLMIKDGALTNPIPSHIIGQHVFPSMQVGKVGICSGLYMASADEIYITVNGKGGHAATPHETNDTVVMASAIIMALQSIVSRRANAAIPSVLSFGKINTVGGATNVIPDQINIDGTFRTMDENWRIKAHELIRSTAQATAQAYGGAANVDIQIGYPCLINDESTSASVKSKMIEYLGAENVEDLPIRMTSEDFAFYTHVVPGCFYRLGTGNTTKGITSPVHTSTFDIDEDALTIGAGLMAYLCF
jgi:amidohydrolase